jgi:hypothetical protein
MLATDPGGGDDEGNTIRQCRIGGQKWEIQDRGQGPRANCGHDALEVPLESWRKCKIAGRR